MDPISFEEARDVVLTRLPKTSSETVEILEALGMVLAGDVKADRDQPGEDRALRDGYALSAEWVRDASGASPVGLSVGFQISAGDVPSSALEPGTCAGIATGAPLPPGADAVVPLEDVESEGERILFRSPVDPFTHVRRRGEYFRKGEVLARAGAVIRPEEIQALAAAGNSHVPTVRPPRVAVISTGSELVDVGETVGAGQLWASNLYYIAAYVQGGGGKPHVLRIVPDSPRAIEEALREADAEMIVTTGGTARGTKDFMRDVLTSLGASIHFDQVSMSPGRSFIFATLGSRAVFCFPGSPGASRTLAWLFLCPAIRKVAGHTAWDPVELAAVLETDVTTQRGLTRFKPATVSRHAEGLKVLPVDLTERDLYAPASEVNALIVIPADVDFLTSGYEVQVVLIGDVGPAPDEAY